MGDCNSLLWSEQELQLQSQKWVQNPGLNYSYSSIHIHAIVIEIVQLIAGVNGPLNHATLTY